MNDQLPNDVFVFEFLTTAAGEPTDQVASEGRRKVKVVACLRVRGTALAAMKYIPTNSFSVMQRPASPSVKTANVPISPLELSPGPEGTDATRLLAKTMTAPDVAARARHRP
ncbi:hypothetical protein CSKR_202397 [Clonorchis sinensis]|uniref:Uncharacterized protein n=1 Tax=Clonorchis sinensis TaxID=79923 RepID=A0A8T1MVC7_CLOSI|nr:hypothetical protein CSKR_202397 [Clonorchis sinensis]